MIRYIVQAVEERRAGVDYLKSHLPELAVAWDTEKCPPRSAMSTFLRSLEMAGDDASVHFEDDVCLTVEFVRKLEAAIVGHEGDIVQFFSRSVKDVLVGSRWASYYSSLCCTYFPSGIPSRIRAFYDSEEWASERDVHLSGLDTMIDKFVSVNRLRLWVHIPSLVQHATAPSVIGVKGYGRDRSHFRQSPTFVDPELSGYPYSYPRKKMFDMAGTDNG